MTPRAVPVAIAAACYYYEERVQNVPLALWMMATVAGVTRRSTASVAAAAAAPYCPAELSLRRRHRRFHFFWRTFPCFTHTAHRRTGP